VGPLSSGPNLVNQNLVEFANASGLSINWQKLEARWLASYDRPPVTAQLDWLWKEPSEPSTMLGFSFREGLTSDLQFKSLLDKLQLQLRKWDSFPLTLQGKVVVANHLVVSGLWYVLTLNALNSTRLNHLQALVVGFIWGGCQLQGRHRVSMSILLLPHAQGGLGLINLAQQAHALGQRIFLWTL
jgi:hypothetical protein